MCTFESVKSYIVRNARSLVCTNKNRDLKIFFFQKHDVN